MVWCCIDVYFIDLLGHFLFYWCCIWFHLRKNFIVWTIVNFDLFQLKEEKSCNIMPWWFSGWFLIFSVTLYSMFLLFMSNQSDFVSIGAFISYPFRQYGNFFESFSHNVKDHVMFMYLILGLWHEETYLWLVTKNTCVYWITSSIVLSEWITV